LKGDFIWHDHKETDETFIVIEGTLRIDFRDGAVLVSSGEMFVVPRGVEHKPYAEQEVKLMLIPQFPNKFPPALMRDRFCGVRRLRLSQVRVAGHLRTFVVAHGESRWNRILP